MRILGSLLFLALLCKTSDAFGSKLSAFASTRLHATTPPPASVERTHIPLPWSSIKKELKNSFSLTDSQISKYELLDNDKPALLKIYDDMILARSFENSCNQEYMKGKIRGFMHLDNGQESIPALVASSIRPTDKKYSYYREHTHALASGVAPGAIMAELMMKETGTCKVSKPIVKCMFSISC